MDKDFMQYVYARCGKAVSEDAEYMELQKRCVDAQYNNDTKLARDISDEMDSRSQELCYIKGFYDGMRLLMGVSK